MCRQDGHGLSPQNRRSRNDNHSKQNVEPQKEEEKKKKEGKKTVMQGHRDQNRGERQVRVIQNDEGGNEEDWTDTETEYLEDNERTIALKDQGPAEGIVGGEILRIKRNIQSEEEDSQYKGHADIFGRVIQRRGTVRTGGRNRMTDARDRDWPSH